MTAHNVAPAATVYVPFNTVCMDAVVPLYPLPPVATVNVLADVSLDAYNILSQHHTDSVALLNGTNTSPSSGNPFFWVELKYTFLRLSVVAAADIVAVKYDVPKIFELDKILSLCFLSNARG